VCKIFESIVRDNLIEHFKQNKYFSDRQFGFLNGRSTITQLLSMLDHWTELLESGGEIGGPSEQQPVKTAYYTGTIFA